MPRTLVRHIVRTDTGAVVVAAKVEPLVEGTTTAVTDAYSTETGGVAATSFLTNAQGECVFWMDTYRDQIDLRVSSNSTAYLPGASATLFAFATFTETVPVPAPSATFVRVYEGPLSLKDSRVNAKLDNVTDDTAAINTAVGLLPAAGGKIFGPPGKALTSGPINLNRSSIEFEGAAAGSGTADGFSIRNIATDGTHVINVVPVADYRRRVAIRNLRIDGVAGGGRGVNLVGVVNSEVENVEVVATGGHGVYIETSFATTLRRVLSAQMRAGFNAFHVVPAGCTTLVLDTCRAGNGSTTSDGLHVASSTGRLASLRVEGGSYESSRHGLHLNACNGLYIGSGIHFEANIAGDIRLGTAADANSECGGVALEGIFANGSGVCPYFILFDYVRRVAGQGLYTAGHTGAAIRAGATFPAYFRLDGLSGGSETTLFDAACLEQIARFTDDGQQLGPYGTEALPALAFGADPDTGMWRSAANELAWSVGAVAYMKLSASRLSLGTDLRPSGAGVLDLGGNPLRWRSLYNQFLYGVEVADPAAPSADQGVVYFRDNGAGKTQLCVRFATGAVQVIATEP